MRHHLHDYASGGGYFVTFVTFKRIRLLGDLRDGGFHESGYGRIVRETWEGLPGFFPGLMLDAFQLMSDHVHCICIVTEPKLLGYSASELPSLPRIIQALKGMSSRAINQMDKTPGRHVWQEGYHERIIRNEKELEKFRGYITTNPLRSELKRS